MLECPSNAFTIIDQVSNILELMRIDSKTAKCIPLQFEKHLARAQPFKRYFATMALHLPLQW